MNNNFWNNKYLRNNILSSHIFLKSKFQAFPKIIISLLYDFPNSHLIQLPRSSRVTPNQLLPKRFSTFIRSPPSNPRTRSPEKLTCASCVQPPRLQFDLGPSPTIKRRDRWLEKRLTLVTRVLFSRRVWITCSISLQNRASAEITT